MFGEVKFRVKCEAKNFRMFVCGDGGVVDLESELGVVFCWVWCEKDISFPDPLQPIHLRFPNSPSTHPTGSLR